MNEIGSIDNQSLKLSFSSEKSEDVKINLCAQLN